MPNLSILRYNLSFVATKEILYVYLIYLELAGDVVTAMATEQLINEDHRLPIMNTLLLKHESEYKAWMNLSFLAIIYKITNRNPEEMNFKVENDSLLLQKAILHSTYD